MNLHCEKDDPQVDFINSQNQFPPITTSGANTFGCTVNGKNWVAYTDYSFPKLRTFYDKKSGSLDIVADRRRKNQSGNDEIRITGYGVLIPGKYLLGYYLSTNARGYISYAPPNSMAYTYLTNNTYTGELNVLYIDTIHRIVSGTFKAKLSFYDTTIVDTIYNLESGRFDVKY
jgi:hypothetical protein